MEQETTKVEIEVVYPRKVARDLIQRLGEASRRPLFMEITQPTVVDLLDQLQLRFLQESEYETVLSICTSLVVQFLLPHSNEYYLLQNTNHHPRNEQEMQEYLRFHVPLLEQLDRKTKYTALTHFSRSPMLTDPDLDRYWDTLWKSLGTLLSQRPLSTTRVDFLHLLGMMLHPCPDTLEQQRLSSNTNTPFARTAVRLMNHPVAHQFHIVDKHRTQLLEWMEHYLVWPELADIHDGSTSVGPLLHGALPHLQSALLSMNSFVAERVWIKISAQALHDGEALLHRLLEGHHDDGLLCYHCSAARQLSNCRFRQRGRLLQEYIVQACGQSSIDKSMLFGRSLTRSLAYAIEWQIESWMVKKTDQAPTNELDNEKRYPPCLLASLLLAARSLCVFYHPPATTDASSNNQHDDKNDDDPYHDLVQNAIQMLHHSDLGVCQAAVDFLVSAYSYASAHSVQQYEAQLAAAVPECLSLALLRLDKLVAVGSQQSESFATAILNVVINKIKKAEGDCLSKLFPLVSAIAVNCPVAAYEQVESLVKFLTSESTKESRIHLFYALLSSRLVLLAADKDVKEVEKSLENELVLLDNRWDLYRVARHALVTGNFRVAALLFGTIQESEIDQGYFLWLSVLESVAKAETALTTKGPLGIPDTATKVQTAVLRLRHLGFHCKEWTDRTLFQRRFLLLRLDFLDLITALRQLTREMRLTGKAPGKARRSTSHLRTIVKAFDALCVRYRVFSRQYGLCLQHSQSVLAIGILQRLAEFVSRAAHAAYPDILSFKANTSKTTEIHKFACNYQHPMAYLMLRLDELIVQPMIGSPSLDLVVRSAALLEVIERLLMVSAPFPRDFLTPHNYPPIELNTTSEPSELGEDVTAEALHTIHTSPRLGATMYVSGSIPDEYMQRSRLPLPTFLLWLKLVYLGPLEPLDDDADPLPAPMIPDFSTDESPFSTAIAPNGNFFGTLDLPPFVEVEGRFLLKLKAGCRDVDDNEWELPLPSNFISPTIRVERQ